MINPVNYNIVTFTSKKNKPHEPIKESVNLHKRLINDGFYEHSPNPSVRFDYLYSEIDEFRQAALANDKEGMKEEIGDVIFDAILLADAYNIDPTEALKQTNRKIDSRLVLVNQYAEKPILEYTFDERMQFWEKAKRSLRGQD